MCIKVKLPVEGFQFKNLGWILFEQCNDHLFQILFLEASACAFLLSHDCRY